MKSIFKLLFLILVLVFFGWAYIMYLYLHKENQNTLENIKSDFQKETKKIVKEVNKQKEQLVETFSVRQEDLVGFIKSMQKEAFEIKEIAERFKNVSERTLRRDMQKLENMGMIKKVGSTRDSKYKIIT